MDKLKCTTKMEKSQWGDLIIIETPNKSSVIVGFVLERKMVNTEAMVLNMLKLCIKIKAKARNLAT